MNNVDQYAMMLGKCLVAGLVAASNADSINLDLQRKNQTLEQMHRKFEELEKQVKKMEKSNRAKIARLEKKLKEN